MATSLLYRLSDNNLLLEDDNNFYALLPYDVLITEIKMVLNSRVRQQEIEDTPLISDTILNYGIDESFTKVSEVKTRMPLLETRLRQAISRFEPRLKNVSLTSSVDDFRGIFFNLHACYINQPLTLELRWDDYTARFYFNE